MSDMWNMKQNLNANMKEPKMRLSNYSYTVWKMYLILYSALYTGSRWLSKHIICLSYLVLTLV